MLNFIEMSLYNKISAGSDDEDDLETLRLAALQSLKPKNTLVPKSLDIKSQKFQQNFRSTFGAAQTTRHSSKSFRNGSSRGGRNGFTRARTNTNLISIQPVDHSDSKENKINDCNSETQKLVLPQDRYCKTTSVCGTVQDSTTNNKFDRYDNSEHSDSDSDEQSVDNEGNCSRAERDNSVERLINDIDSEINELINRSEKSKPPKKTEEKLEKSDELLNKSDCLVITPEVDDIVEINNEEILLDEEKIPIQQSPSLKHHSPTPVPPYYRRSNSRSPPRKRYSPLHYQRPLSPLFTDVLGTIARAPLSPRSAAFVLQNHEILARRKLSPGRRSLSPRKRSRSRSPYDKDRKRSSLSPRERKRPVYKRLGNRPETKNTDVVKRRRSRSTSLSLSPSPERNYQKRPLNETTGSLRIVKRIKPEEEEVDPVLERRRKKFESIVNLENGLKINLKSIKEKSDVQPEKTDVVADNVVEDDVYIDLNPSINDLWSDEDDSDSENEARFKSNPNPQKRIVRALPFTKLLERPVPTATTLWNPPRANREKKKRHRSKSPNVKKSRKEDRVCSRRTEKYNDKIEKDVVQKLENEKQDTDVVDNGANDKCTKKVSVDSTELGLNELNNDEPEIIIENDEEPVSTKEDDLRAELSRRRAQRMMKSVTGVSTRLLKSALEEVVAKQNSKKPKRTLSSSDRRVLILKRLIANPSTTKTEATVKVSRTSARLPIHMRLGMSALPERSEDSIRRPKRSRSGRRKKPSSQV